MNRTIFARLGAASAACLACATLPAAASAAPTDGGVAYGTPTAAAPATAEGGTLLVRSAVILGRTLRVRGSMAHGQPGRRVIVERQAKDGSWKRTATARTTDGGAFAASWKTDNIGRFPLRAIPAPVAGATVAAVPATGTTAVTVYRHAVATYYGPGFFGNRTACGQTLRRSTLGVAHRTLPCGTMVALYHKGRTITVPVIDRGPFRAGTAWDLTAATATALNFTATGRIGALRLPRRITAR